MKIVSRTDDSYAHIEMDQEDQREIIQLQKEALATASESLQGLRIEVSEHDSIPDAIRRRLSEGKFLLL